MLDKDIIIIHLYRNRFIPNYKYWYLHRKMWEIIVRVRSQQDRDTDRMIDMTMNTVGLEFDWDIKDDPKAGNGNFYYMLKDADKPLWSKCEIHCIISYVRVVELKG